MKEQPTDKLIYHGRRIDLYLRKVPTRDGGFHDYEVITHPGAVVILPFVDKEHICLVENLRHSVGAKLLELPAGTLEPGEETLDSAKRELAEETGYTARKWTFLHTFYPSPGVYGEKMFLFVAEELSPGTQHLDPTEVLTPIVIRFEDAVDRAIHGGFQDAKTILGILLWEKLRSGKR